VVYKDTSQVVFIHILVRMKSQEVIHISTENCG